ncbi:hypothetical protein A2W24_00375 [Microgenomates group bacterium RBG_16_45_19]|nr:MAG: hypothetical protein A2W24_00375 [Microgenomates group bacterium RBG_16_45_19]
MLKKYFPLFITGIVILIGLIFYLLTPKEPALPPATPTPSTQTPTITYSGPTIPIPPYLPTYQIIPTDLSLFGQQLATTLNLDPHPQSSSLWTKNEVSLNLIPANHTLAISYFRPLISQPGIDVSAAITAAQQLAVDLGLNNVTLDQENILLTSNVPDYINLSPQDNLPPQSAQRIIIPFHFQLNDIPVYYHHQLQGDMNIILNSQNQPLKISFSPPPSQTSNLGNVPTKSPTLALPNVYLHPEALFVRDTAAPQATLSQFQSLDLSQGGWEYRQDKAGTKIIPYYHFYGNGILTDDTQVAVELIVPAI